MISRTRLVPMLALAALVAGSGRAALAQQEERPLSPDLVQLHETVADRFHEVADKLGLSPEQRTKVKDAHAAFADKYKALRAARQELLQTEFKAFGEILTPEQRAKVKNWTEEKVERIHEAAAKHQWPDVQPVRENLSDRIQAAADRLGITADQRTKIREAHTAFVDKYRAQHAELRGLVESEFKTLGEILTPAQREKVKSYVEGHYAHAPAVQSVGERLREAADKLGLSTDQRTKIREAHQAFASRYRTLREERRDLLQSELKAVAAVLTTEQKEKVENFFEDRVVVVGLEFDPNDPHAITELRETIRERLDAAAEKLGLSTDQRAKIKDIHVSFAEKYKEQHAKRKELRQEELKALGESLTPEQRDKVKSYIEDKVEEIRGR